MKTRLMEAKPGQYKVQCVLPHVRGGISREGTPVWKYQECWWKFWIRPPKGTKLGVANELLPLNYIFKLDMTAVFFLFSREQPPKEAFTAKSIGVSSWTSEATSNPRFIPLSETMNLPDLFAWEVPTRVKYSHLVPRAQKETWISRRSSD